MRGYRLGPLDPPLPDRPMWWTDSLEACWTAASAEVLASWDRVVGVHKLITVDVLHQALAWGYGAHHAFPALTWAADIELWLRYDWESAPNCPDRWARVADAALHGWEFASPRRPLSSTLLDVRRLGG